MAGQPCYIVIVVAAVVVVVVAVIFMITIMIQSYLPQIILEWRDNRVTFHNLKLDTSLNALTDEDIQQLWLPLVLIYFFLFFLLIKNIFGSISWEELFFFYAPRRVSPLAITVFTTLSLAIEKQKRTKSTRWSTTTLTKRTRQGWVRFGNGAPKSRLPGNFKLLVMWAKERC